jgi:hypothetical protein
VGRFIDGRSPVMAHGSREMPVWGNVFGVERGSARARTEIYAITKYIESIQQE